MPEPIKLPHGNSKDSKKKHHLYAIIEIFRNLVFKFGISGEKLNKDGSSRRANKQVNKLNKMAGINAFKSEILEIDIDGREVALEKEIERTIQHLDANDDNMPDGQKRPNPTKD